MDSVGFVWSSSERNSLCSLPIFPFIHIVSECNTNTSAPNQSAVNNWSGRSQPPSFYIKERRLTGRFSLLTTFNSNSSNFYLSSHSYYSSQMPPKPSGKGAKKAVKAQKTSKRGGVEGKKRHKTRKEVRN